jgi:outer membrane protein OmpA-like peptidoglycan-associated protein
MGLTVAEVFILLAFILLLLIALWRAFERRHCQELLTNLKSTEFVKQFSVKELDWLITASGTDRLSSAIKASAAIEEGARLVEEDDLKQMIEKIEGLPPTRRRLFNELMNAEGYEHVIDWAHKLTQLIENGHAPEEVMQALTLVEELAPDELNDIEELKRRIRRRIQDGESLGRQVAGEIGRAVGDLVSKIGGAIDPASGAVTLPDTALFAQGSAALSEQTRTFLDRFCLPWLATLSGFGSQIGALRIEGHASSEWSVGAGPEDAFLKNMDLSQQRASAVLEYCLRRVADAEQRAWAQSRLVAVGFSSARLILENGKENPVRSRRVVFRTEVDKGKIIADIERELVSPPRPSPERKRGTPKKRNRDKREKQARIIQGISRVIDGDTLEINGLAIRLQGLAAPELDEPGGANAKEFLSSVIGN